jgi:hypothetical protein
VCVLLVIFFQYLSRPTCLLVVTHIAPKQLPPIQQAEAPLGLKAMVGSVYSFCEDLHGVEAEMLDQNYRSNATLVGFSLEAGYRRTLSSYSPNLRLNLVSPLPVDEPEGWPDTLYWTPEWSSLLDPRHPASCFVYPEGRSSQWNLFEADSVVTLIYLLRTLVANGLSGEWDPASGNVLPAGKMLYSPEVFWEKAVGVVTPHRAQQGLIISRLQQIFHEDDPGLYQGRGGHRRTLPGTGEGRDHRLLRSGGPRRYSGRGRVPHEPQPLQRYGLEGQGQADRASIEGGRRPPLCRPGHFAGVACSRTTWTCSVVRPVR